MTPKVRLGAATVARAGGRWYRFLLLAYPRAFRDDAGEEAAHAFAGLCAEHWSRRQYWLLLGRVLLALVEVPRYGLAERFSLRKPRPTSVTRAESRFRPRRAVAQVWRWGLRIGPDARHALRSLRGAPWYGATVVAIVACSTALAATVFAIVDSVLFRSLPYPAPDELFVLAARFDDQPADSADGWRWVSREEVAAWSTFVPDQPVTVLASGSVPLPDGTNALAMSVDPAFFEVFELRLLLGRGFEDEHYDQPYEAPPRPVIISYAIWQEVFGGDPSVVGRRYSPYATAAEERWLPPVFTVVGVLDRDGFVPPAPRLFDNWVQHSSRVEMLLPHAAGVERERGATAYIRVPGGKLASTEAALQAAVRVQGSGASLSNEPYDEVTLFPLATLLTRRQQPIMRIVFAATVGLILMVLLNSGALAAARSRRRLSEFAVRRSLGARTTDLVRTTFVEQGLLVSVGSALGVLGAPWFLYVVIGRLPPGLRGVDDPQVGWRAVTFGIAVAALMTMAMVVLAVRVFARPGPLRPDLADRHGRSPTQARAGRWLVAGQIAVAFTLVLGGAMFITSLGLVWQEHPGFRSRDAAIVTVTFDGMFHIEREMEIAAALRSLPGVAAAGAFGGSILENRSGGSTTFREPSGERPAGVRPAVLRAGPGFLEAAELDLVHGRLPTDVEMERGDPVILVSVALASRYWPSRQAVGQSLLAEGRRYSVVGVVRDARTEALDVEPTGMIVAPLTAATSSRSRGAEVFLALGGPRPARMADVVSHLAGVARDLRVREFLPIEDALAGTIQPRRISALAASTFGAAGVVLTAISLFGLVAQTVGWRMREFGVRLALGDTPSGILRRVLAEPMGAVAAGLLVGGIVAAFASRAASSYLYGIEVYDVRLWAATASLVLTTAILGAWLPAARASRLDPVTTLRQE